MEFKKEHLLIFQIFYGYPIVAVFKKKSEVAKALALSPQVPPHPPFPC